MKLPDVAKRQAKHVLVYGPSKSGKTYLVGRLAEYGFNLKWVDLENGRTTLYQLTPAAQERIDIVNVPDTKDFPIAAETVTKILKGDKVRVCNTHGKISCSVCMKDCPADFTEVHPKGQTLNDILVIDSMTQYSNSIMSFIGKNADDFWRPEWEHYRSQGSMIDRGLTNVQTAPYNIVVITHESMVSLEDGKKKLVPTGGTENFSRTLARYFDEVIYCDIKNKKHIAASSSTYEHNILTGSRSGLVLEKEAEASLLKIFRGETSSQPSEAISHLKAVQQSLEKK